MNKTITSIMLITSSFFSLSSMASGGANFCCVLSQNKQQLQNVGVNPEIIEAANKLEDACKQLEIARCNFKITQKSVEDRTLCFTGIGFTTGLLKSKRISGGLVGTTVGLLGSMILTEWYKQGAHEKPGEIPQGISKTGLSVLKSIEWAKAKHRYNCGTAYWFPKIFSRWHLTSIQGGFKPHASEYSCAVCKYNRALWEYDQTVAIAQGEPRARQEEPYHPGDLAL